MGNVRHVSDDATLDKVFLQFLARCGFWKTVCLQLFCGQICTFDKTPQHHTTLVAKGMMTAFDPL